MDWVLSIFFPSLLACIGIAYLMVRMQSGDTRDSNLISFLILNLCILLWVFFNALSIVIDTKYLRIVYPVKMAAMVFTIFAALWYALIFTKSALAESPLIKRVIFLIPALTSLLMLTNPLHRLFYHDFLLPTRSWGILFWFHFSVIMFCTLLTYLILLRCFLRHFWEYPFISIVVLGMPLPLVCHILYCFNIIGINMDFTPLSYAAVVVSFAYRSYKPRFFHIKSIILNRMCDAFVNAIIIIINREGTIVDTNLASDRYFPELKIKTGKTTLQEIWQYLRPRSEAGESTDLINLIEFSHTESADGEMKIRSDTGETLSFGLSWRSLSSNGQNPGHALILFDITELAKARTMAETSSEAKSEFISRMSHEMRTPMNAIMGMTSIGKSAKNEDEKNYAFNRIEEASIHLLGVINDVLDISKIEANKFELSYYEFDFHKMLNNIKNINRFLVAAQEQNITFDIGEDIPAAVISDEQRLAQVVINLMSNASKFTPKNGSITLSVKKIAGTDDTCKLRFSVTDTGIGISKEQQQHLFIPFEQADGSISRKFGGTGLGLAISKRIIEKMDGNIWIESEMGKGTSFIFEIEVKVCSEIKQSEETRSESESGIFTGKRILIAEDVDINREIISALLGNTGMEIDFALNGTEAVEKFSADSNAYWLILMDIQMPFIDGYEATRRIRSMALPRADNIPIIAMTANVFREDIERCLAAGMNDHLGKPIDMNEVMAKLKKYI